MSSSGFFSGPPSNKATASTIAAAVATLFWTIAAHTFWKTMNTADLTLYVTTSTVILTAIVGFLVPESTAFTEHNKQRLAIRATAQGSPATNSPAQGSPATNAPAQGSPATNSPAQGSPAISPSTASANGAVEAQLQKMQELQGAIAVRLGIPTNPAAPS
jgi:hypothetical protein